MRTCKHTCKKCARKRSIHITDTESKVNVDFEVRSRQVGNHRSKHSCGSTDARKSHHGGGNTAAKHRRGVDTRPFMRSTGTSPSIDCGADAAGLPYAASAPRRAKGLQTAERQRSSKSAGASVTMRRAALPVKTVRFSEPVDDDEAGIAVTPPRAHHRRHGKRPLFTARDNTSVSESSDTTESESECESASAFAPGCVGVRYADCGADSAVCNTCGRRRDRCHGTADLSVSLKLVVALRDASVCADAEAEVLHSITRVVRSCVGDLAATDLC